MQQYASGKLVGSLYFAQVAKENPNLKVYSFPPVLLLTPKIQTSLVRSVSQ